MKKETFESGHSDGQNATLSCQFVYDLTKSDSENLDTLILSAHSSIENKNSTPQYQNGISVGIADAAMERINREKWLANHRSQIDSLTLLRELLYSLDINAQIITLDSPNPILIRREGKLLHATNVVCNGEGEMLGKGLSESEAIIDAIHRLFNRISNQNNRLKTVLKNYREKEVA